VVSSVKPKVEELERRKADPETPGLVFAMLTDSAKPLSLKAIAGKFGVQRGAFAQWFTTQHEELYRRALRVIAEELASDALAIADASDDAKLKVDTRLKLAARYHRELYGEERQLTLGATADFMQALQRISERKHQALKATVSGQVLDAEIVPAPALAAPAAP
jgi:hypothetical protein